MPPKKTITIQLSFNDEGNVTCHLTTNGTPFLEVQEQMKQCIEALQWQVDNARKCPFHTETAENASAAA